jgi:hypothetical protein
LNGSRTVQTFYLFVNKTKILTLKLPHCVNQLINLTSEARFARSSTLTTLTSISIFTKHFAHNSLPKINQHSTTTVTPKTTRTTLACMSASLTRLASSFA